MAAQPGFGQNEILAVTGIGTPPYDYCALNSSASSRDVWTFFKGGPTGDLVSTVTINYVDATKATILNVARV